MLHSFSAHSNIYIYIYCQAPAEFCLIYTDYVLIHTKSTEIGLFSERIKRKHD